MAVMRPCLAERRATRKARIASTAPSRVFACPVAWPDWRSAGRRDGVDRVGLAVAASQLAVRAIHLHDGHALGVQEASESGSVATGPFDADTLDRTESPKPGEQRAVAGPGRRERPYPELSATLIERGDHVLVAVRVGAGRDAPGGFCHGGHRHPFS